MTFFKKNIVHFTQNKIKVTIIESVSIPLKETPKDSGKSSTELPRRVHSFETTLITINDLKSLGSLYLKEAANSCSGWILRFL